MYTIPHYFRKILFFLYLLVIAWVSLSPTDEMPRLISFPHFDKIAHLLMYLIFSLAGIWALDSTKSSAKAKDKAAKGWSYIITILFAIAWGFAMELGQEAMHLGREYSMFDLAANITGALIGAGLYYFLIDKRNTDANKKRV